jgi:response regulator RpfG family c-di-GMP phosphodiesterase/serine/threonine protein kinase
VPFLATENMSPITLKDDSSLSSAPAEVGLDKRSLLPRPGRECLEQLVQHQLIEPSRISSFLSQHGDSLNKLGNPAVLCDALIQAGLLTEYQLSRVQAGTMHGLVLGAYRVLDRLGGGAVGVVFLGEHIILRRRVAIKVVPVDDGFPPSVLERFYTEMRALAELQHPHVVQAYDAGHLPAPAPTFPALHYLVMEWVPGGDLEQYVYNHGPLPIAWGCEWARQTASGLQAAHDRHLIHRDLKPSNLLLAADEQVKLVDFGLARRFIGNKTDPRALLGTVEFMAPEQSIDPAGVSSLADVYSLGATLLWLLTGQTPYPVEESIAKALYALQHEKPRRLRQFLPDAPQELDDLIDSMLAGDPRLRPQTPLAVMPILARFATPSAPYWELDPVTEASELAAPAAELPPAAPPEPVTRVLIAGGSAKLRQQIRETLHALGSRCGEATSGAEALAALRREPYDLVLLDTLITRPTADDICRELRGAPPRPHLKLLLHGAGAPHAFAEAMLKGADDYLSHPLDMPHIAAKVQHALRLKSAQDRADRFAQHLLRINRQVHHSLRARTIDVRQAQDAMLFAMAKLAESRDGETTGHLRRLQQYSTCLARHLSNDPAWYSVVDDAFLEQLERCVPLHDIGKLALPDGVLLKPGPLTAEERRVMETHTLIGSDILEAIGRAYGDSLVFLAQARAIVRHHHERYDGTGYPDRLYGDAIPPAARIIALADVYDALRRKRSYKPAFSHARAVQCILRESVGAFDPSVLNAFAECQDRFQRVFLSVVS